MLGETANKGAMEPAVNEKLKHVPNPKRVAAGKRNRALWTGFTCEGLERLRKGALKHKPWLTSTGPRTLAGKARAARNGMKKQSGPKSVRQIKKELADLRVLMLGMQEACHWLPGRHTD